MSPLVNNGPRGYLRECPLYPQKRTLYSEMNHAATGCMGDGVCTADRIELVDQSLRVCL